MAILTYEDLAPGGRLEKYVSTYTYFNTDETNEAFLRVHNWDADDDAGGCSPGDGLCVGLFW